MNIIVYVSTSFKCTRFLNQIFESLIRSNYIVIAVFSTVTCIVHYAYYTAVNYWKSISVVAHYRLIVVKIMSLFMKSFSRFTICDIPSSFSIRVYRLRKNIFSVNDYRNKIKFFWCNTTCIIDTLRRVRLIQTLYMICKSSAQHFFNPRLQNLLISMRRPPPILH